MKTGTAEATETAGLRRAAYLVVTLFIAVAGWAATVAGGFEPVAVGVGVGAAWTIQAGSFWVLAGGLARGDRVLRVWAGGMASRVGGLLLLWIGAWLAGAPAREPVVAYAFALVAFLLLEAGWLAVVAPRQARGSRRERPGGTQDTERLVRE
jgi:hypothetical protein